MKQEWDVDKASGTNSLLDIADAMVEDKAATANGSRKSKAHLLNCDLDFWPPRVGWCCVY